MDKESAKKLIKNTFQDSFDKEKFIYFIKNLLNRYDESKVFHLHGCYIPDSFKDYIKSYERIGTYTDPEGKKIDILIVHLKRESTVDRARTAQRNFIARYLKERGEKDAGLIAFVSPQEEDWRFSFVKMEYKFEKTPKGDVKVKEEFTPARRYSFLVGKNESSHTAQSCFVDILINDIHNLKLSEVEEAFNIEKVTKEFYEKYRNLFLQVKDTLDEIVKEDEEIRKEFQEKGVNVVDFSKKLLGQIVFLYFLQKKGWFGVPRGKDWGEGDKKFLRNLFDIAKKENRNYFNKFLEPLFYEALRLERPKDYYAQFNCRIPFLNGGLFDPLNDYDWQDTDIEIPNEIFSNNHNTKEGDTGDGILDVFDRYNFTVKEDEPLEKEVAVDPEMLGKVFENLLEVKDRKSKGTYYTPREIVHYMCQQSLINYLYTEVKSKQKSRTKEEKIQMKLLGKPDPIQGSLIIEKDSTNISKEDLEKLIKYGDTTIENDNHVVNNGEETKAYSFKLPENIRKNAEIIDEALKNIRVCDPAIGSGAFPVGMMNEIIRARNVLTSYLSLQEAEATKQSRTMYNFKRHAIQNCLYGVDIDPGACEIAKLRLWLSLMVDEEDINKIKPLPNLDYKIMQGNSLISEFMGIDLDNDKEKNEKEKLFSTNESNELYEMLKVKKDELLNQPNINKKKVLKEEIENLIVNIFEIKLQKQKSDYFKEAREIEEKWERHPVKEEREREIKKEKDVLSRKTGFNLDKLEEQLRQYTNNQKIRPFFPWQLYFSEVFQEKNGFDVVIANPPYGAKFNGEEKRFFKENYNYSIKGKFESYRIFIERGINLLHKEAVLTYVVPNTWMFVEQAFPLRKFILTNLSLKHIISFPQKSFNATVDSIAFLLLNTVPKNNIAKVIDMPLSESLKKIDVYVNKKIIYKQKGWLKSDNKIISYGIKQSERDLFERIMNSTEKFSSHIIIRQGLIPYLTKEEGKVNKYISKNKIDNTWKKYLDGSRFVSRYYINSKTSFIKYGDWLYAQREKWIFSKERIIFQLIRNISLTRRIIATYLDYELYSDRNTGLIFQKKSSNLNLKFIIGIFNSNLINFIHSKSHNSTYISFPSIEKLPLVFAKDDEKGEIVTLVDKILSINKDDNYLANPIKQIKERNYEKQINEIVYELYGLTGEEINTVEIFYK